MIYNLNVKFQMKKRKKKTIRNHGSMKPKRKKKSMKWIQDTNK